jgi:hypothetical protein
MMMVGTPEDDGPRERVVSGLDKKSDFRIHLLIYVLVNGLLVVIWAMTGSGFFWPIFPMAGWGIGVVANALGRLQPGHADGEPDHAADEEAGWTPVTVERTVDR